jgi:hypothetical protein
MIASGLIKRRFYSQPDLFNWAGRFHPASTYGRIDFGFSGDNITSNYSLESGKLIKEDSSFLFSYQADEDLFVSGNYTAATEDLWVNNNPLILGGAKDTGIFNYFYLDASNGPVVDFDVFINGDQPNPVYNLFDTFLSGEQLSFSVVNNSSYPIRIFSGESLLSNFEYDNSSVNLDILQGGTGEFFINSLAFSPGLQNIPINLFTDYGTINLFLSGIGVDLTDQDFYLLLGPEVFAVQEGIANVYVANYFNETGADISVRLEYVSGVTGEYYGTLSQTGFLENQDVSGLIRGSGVLTSVGTGIISEYNDILEDFEYGIGTGIMEEFVYAEGILDSGYDIRLAGSGTGIINTGFVGTGETIISFQGEVSQLNPFITITGISGDLTGYLNGDEYTGYTESGIATLSLNLLPQTGVTINLLPEEYESVDFSITGIYATGLWELNYAIKGLAYATGGLVSGKLIGDFGFQYEPGEYVFFKDGSGIGTGVNSVITGFDPVSFRFEQSQVTGFITGTRITGVNIDGCVFQIGEGLPLIAIPEFIYDASGNAVEPISIGLILPTDTGEFSRENIDYFLTGGEAIRTKISRAGNTPSGNGYFNNVIQEPFFTGFGNEEVYTEYGWIENLTSVTDLVKNENELPFMISAETSMVLLDSTGTGSSLDTEASIMEFLITGSGSGFYALQSDPDFGFKSKIALENLSTNQLLFSGSGFHGLDTFLSVNFYSDFSYDTNGAFLYTGLETGHYRLTTRHTSITGLSSSQNLNVFFSNASFTGCENSGFVGFRVNKAGGSYPALAQVRVFPTSSDFPQVNADYPSGEFSTVGDTVYYNFFMDGTQTSQDFLFPILDDGNYETLEKFTAILEIIQPTSMPYGGYVYSSRSISELVIQDDDAVEDFERLTRNADIVTGILSGRTVPSVPSGMGITGAFMSAISGKIQIRPRSICVPTVHINSNYSEPTPPFSFTPGGGNDSDNDEGGGGDDSGFGDEGGRGAFRGNASSQSEGFAFGDGVRSGGGGGGGGGAPVKPLPKTSCQQPS